MNKMAGEDKEYSFTMHRVCPCLRSGRPRIALWAFAFRGPQGTNVGRQGMPHVADFSGGNLSRKELSRKERKDEVNDGSGVIDDVRREISSIRDSKSTRLRGLMGVIADRQVS
jgi:hypothetical protein